jgi:acyl carrier protein
MHWGFRPALILPLPRESFPKTSLGKIQRALMRKRLESGGFFPQVEAVGELTLRQPGGYTGPQSDTDWQLAAIYAEMFDTETERISATASFFDLGGTSLDILRLRLHVARAFGVADLQIITVLTAPSVRALAAHRRRAGRRRLRGQRAPLRPDRADAAKRHQDPAVLRAPRRR